MAQSMWTMAEVVGCGSGLVGWHMEDVLSGELAGPGRGSPSEVRKAQMSKHRKIKI